MFIAIDFDGTVVHQDDRRYDDLTTPLTLIPGAKAGLLALKAAGHHLMLWSGRSSPSLLLDAYRDPFVRAGIRRHNPKTWGASLEVNRARFVQMVDFVERELPGIFDVVDDGVCGKPTVDLFIDDKALRAHHGPGGHPWKQIAYLYGSKAPIAQGEGT